MLVPVFPAITGLPAGKEQVLQAFLPMAQIIGAISSATAPGAVLAIISELRARVPFTTTLLGVIALDDALTIILFAVAGTVAHGLIGPDGMEIAHLMRIPAMEIGLSLVMGTTCGLALKYMGRITNRGESAIMVVSGMALLIRKNQAHMHAKVADCHSPPEPSPDCEPYAPSRMSRDKNFPLAPVSGNSYLCRR